MKDAKITTSLTHHGAGVSFSYAGQPMHILAGQDGQRHAFSNPFGEPALVLGLWGPPGPALAFMRDVGAALRADAPPDPEQMRDIYHRHASRLLP